jgi:endonuclease YncB( thermonuclease family)
MAVLGWSMGGLLATTLALAAGSQNASESSKSFDGPVQADVVRVIDGDTFEAAAKIWLGQAIDVHVRIEGIDAPELHAHCDEERAHAEAARDYLAHRIEGAAVQLSHVHYDKYGGRVDATVRDSTGDIAAAMLKAGMAREYHGERRQPWCPTAS